MGVHESSVGRIVRHFKPTGKIVRNTSPGGPLKVSHRGWSSLARICPRISSRELKSNWT